ncbi:cell surface protein (Mas1) [Metarhizium rileyi]|uniref:Cell surface protein (Mas1) n=1 Tax=Metarhizium rileyi (strain RCEF 4871) TaxID=1649241 RepID=A0A162I404_METRR|nr:cell surface protein (Mas1) [Metarhizium rileyi RCEF 4871]
MAATVVVSGHGVIRAIQGANNVTMPGLLVADGTPRDCVVNACGAQADTGIIRDNEITSGKYGPLGWTQGYGKVDPDLVVANFMGIGPRPPTNKGASDSVGVEDDLSALSSIKQRREEYKRQMSNFFQGIANLPIVGTLGVGGNRNTYPVETLNGDMRGEGAQHGLPTCDEDGVVNLVYRQINQDGAGPMTAAVDPCSGGKNGKAFVTARVVRDVPGSGVSGLSISTNTDYAVQVKIPEGTICKGEIAGVKNVCVVRVRNQALAGPFGGAAAFTQSSTNRKRALEYRLRKRAARKI